MIAVVDSTIFSSEDSGVLVPSSSVRWIAPVAMPMPPAIPTGVRLNYPEAIALIATQLLEVIRDGRRVAELMDIGRTMGDANASIPTPEPMMMRPMFGARGRAIGDGELLTCAPATSLPLTQRYSLF